MWLVCGCCGAGGGLSVYCQGSLGAGAQEPRYFPCQHRPAEWPWSHGANGLEIIGNISICSPHWAAHYMLTCAMYSPCVCSVCIQYNHTTIALLHSNHLEKNIFNPLFLWSNMPIKVSWVLEMSPLCDWRHIKTMGGESEQFKQFKQQPVIENNNNTPRGAPLQHNSTTAQQCCGDVGFRRVNCQYSHTRSSAEFDIWLRHRSVTHCVIMLLLCK